MTKKLLDPDTAQRQNEGTLAEDVEAQVLRRNRRRKLIKGAISSAPLIVALPGANKAHASGEYLYNGG